MRGQPLGNRWVDPVVAFRKPTVHLHELKLDGETEPILSVMPGNKAISLAMSVHKSWVSGSFHEGITARPITR